MVKYYFEWDNDFEEYFVWNRDTGERVAKVYKILDAIKIVDALNKE